MLRYGSYNVANAFVDPAKSDRVLDELADAAVDVCVLPEVLPAGHEMVDARGRFDRAGFDFLSQDNEDADNRRDTRQTGVAVRRGAGISQTPSSIRLATRNAWYLPYVMPGTARQIEFFGVHLNDRGNDERAVQIDALEQNFTADTEQIVVGDINADYESTAFRGFCRFLGLATSFVPESQPKKLSRNLPTPGRIRSIARRLDEATDGTTMARLWKLGLHDADPNHQTTTERMKFLLLSLDRGMVSENIITSDFKVGRQTVSDHRLISFAAEVSD